MTRCRTFRYQLQPTARQRAALETLLRNQCELYNAALEERRGAWKWERRSVSYIDQCKTLTDLRGVRPEVLVHGVTVCRGTLKRLDKAFIGFYRRCRTGQTPGFPRFKSFRRWDSVRWEQAKGWKVSGDHLHLHGIGNIKVRLHRPLRGIPKTVTVKKEGRRWYVSIQCGDVPAEPLPPTGQQVGLDLGIIALVATSDGELFTGNQNERRVAAKLATAQCNLSRKRCGSNRHMRQVERVAATHRKVRNQRADQAHKLSRQLVNDYDLIVHEDLKIANMVCRPKPRPNPDQPGNYLPNGAAAKGGLNRSIQDAGWGQLLSFIAYKAEDAGREVIAVDPRHTSQRCAQCGHTEAGNRVTQAAFRCLSCGHEANADVNAAVNILRAGRALQASACAGSVG